MAIRFRRSIRIAPGVRLNLGKKGVSVSAGPRGSTVTLGKNGLWGNIGLPGTGLSYRTKLGKSATETRHAQQAAKREAQQQAWHTSGLSKLTLTLDDKGQLLMADEMGVPLTAPEKRQAWQLAGEHITQWLSEQCALINGDMSLILNIHHDIQPPGSAIPEYEAEPFSVPAPSHILPVSSPLAPEKPEFSVQFWERLLPGRVAKKTQLHQTAQLRWEQDHRAWQSLCQEQAAKYQQQRQDYGQQQQVWLEEKQQFAAEQQLISEQFQQRLANDDALIAELLSAELAQLVWPRETQIEFELTPTALHFIVDLPEVADLPIQTAQFSANNQRLLIKDKSARQLREEYARHIHGVLLRLAGLLFSLLPCHQKVVMSGYSQRLDAATGHINDEYLLSVAINQSDFAKLNFAELELIDPIAALAQFELVRDMSKTGVFKPISPLVPASGTDKP